MYILLHIFPRVVIYLGWLLPNTSSGSPKTEREKDQPLSLRPCSLPGFTEPTPLDVAGALLPHLCTLTKCRGSSQTAPTFLAVFFCGTILTVACTGRYPASLIFRESGLSSVFAT